MATTQTSVSREPLSPMAIFVLTSATAASAITIEPGFTPRRIELLDTTTGNTAEWIQGMAALYVNTMVASTGAVTAATSGGFDITTAEGQVVVPAALQPAAGVTVVVCHR